jgi:beta-N-acetylhexosaminidase
MSASALRRRVGQLVALGIPGHTLPVEWRSLVREFGVGGIILFGRNVSEPAQVAELAFACRNLSADPPLWVAVDQEGGRVARLRAPLTVWPPVASVGRCGDERVATAFAAALARELRSVGITFNSAPVLDVLTTARNPAIGDRAIAGDAPTVARLGTAMVNAMQAEGVAACGKHFPGHGDTSVDSHHDLPVVEHGLDRLRAIEYEPFRAAIAADVAGIMVAHLLVPALDEDRPASLSRRVVTGELREALGFDGLIVTDDLNMKGCSARFPLPEATVEAIAAGHDLALLCEPNLDEQAAALEALVRAVESGTVSTPQVDRSVARHLALKARYVASSDDDRAPSSRWRGLIGCEAHQLVAAELRQYA